MEEDRGARKAKRAVRRRAKVGAARQGPDDVPSGEDEMRSEGVVMSGAQTGGMGNERDVSGALGGVAVFTDGDAGPKRRETGFGIPSEKANAKSDAQNYPDAASVKKNRRPSGAQDPKPDASSKPQKPSLTTQKAQQDQ